MRTCFALLLVALLLSIDPRGRATTVVAADDPGLPPNIVVHEWLTAMVQDMLRGSDTFRAQCHWIGGVKRLRVAVSPHPDADPSPRASSNAKCVMKRYQYGHISAEVRLMTLADAPRLISHEFEHVREYVDGMNYLLTSVQHPTQVWTTLEGHYETARAIRTGDRVASEMIRYRSQQATATVARRTP